MSRLQSKVYEGIMSRQQIIPNIKFLLESNDYENIYLVSSFCYKDNIQIFYRVIKEKSNDEKEEMACPICGESVECFGGTSGINGDSIEVVACLTERKNELILVMDNTNIIQLKSVLLLIIERHDFSAYYQVIKLYQSSDLLKQMNQKNWKKKLESQKPLQTCSVSKTWPQSQDEKDMKKSSPQKEKNLSARRQATVEKKKNLEQLWRQQIQNSAKELIASLKKNAKLEESRSQSRAQRSVKLFQMGSFKRELTNSAKKSLLPQSTNTIMTIAPPNLSQWKKSLNVKLVQEESAPKLKNKLSQRTQTKVKKSRKR